MAISADKLAEILAGHLKWLRSEDAEGRADLSRADLSRANLSSANLYGANLYGADLSSADLSSANLSSADLCGADLSSADLCRANLYGANLSSARKLLDPITYLTENFEQDPDGRGFVAYKQFGLHKSPAEHWQIEAGAVLSEVVNPDRSLDCGSGVNVATRAWLRVNGDKAKSTWRCLIRWPWLVGVLVPFQADGKIRASRVELLEIVND